MLPEELNAQHSRLQRSTKRSTRSILAEGHGGGGCCCCCCCCSPTLWLCGLMATDRGQAGDGAACRSANQGTAGAGAQLHLSGSECCFLRMSTTPGVLLLWNVLSRSVCVWVWEKNRLIKV